MIFNISQTQVKVFCKPRPILIGLVSLVDGFPRPATATGSLFITPAGSVKSVPITTTDNYNKPGHVHVT